MMMPISQALKVSGRAMKQAKDPRASIAPDPTDFKRFSVDHI